MRPRFAPARRTYWWAPEHWLPRRTPRRSRWTTS